MHHGCAVWYYLIYCHIRHTPKYKSHTIHILSIWQYITSIVRMSTCNIVYVVFKTWWVLIVRNLYTECCGVGGWHHLHENNLKRSLQFNSYVGVSAERQEHIIHVQASSTRQMYSHGSYRRKYYSAQKAQMEVRLSLNPPATTLTFSHIKGSVLWTIHPCLTGYEKQLLHQPSQLVCIYTSSTLDYSETSIRECA